MGSRSAYIFPVLLAGALSCVHQPRRPAAWTAAQNYQERHCENVFDQKAAEFTLHSEKYWSLRRIQQGFEYIEKAFPGEVEALFAQDKPVCERVRDFNDTTKDIALKLETIESSIKLLEKEQLRLNELIVSPMFSYPAFPVKAACLAGCVSKSAKECAVLCEVRPEFIEQISKIDTFGDLAAACAQSPEFFQNLLNSEVPVWRRQTSQAILPTYEKILKSATAAKAALAGTQTVLKQVKRAERNPDCDVPPPQWYSQIRKSVAKIESPGGVGSAFFFRFTPGLLRAATAEHIYNISNSEMEYEFRKAKLTVSEAGKRLLTRSWTLTFGPRAGMFDRAHDVIQTPAEGVRVPGLSLTHTDNIPKPGQIFWAAGYPTIRKGVFSLYRCSFYGFGPVSGKGNSVYSYVLRCPSVEGNLAGISGGPLLDENGDVWGVITDHNTFLARIFVSPISMDHDLRVHVGIQHTFVSDHCLQADEAGLGRCQVMPGQHDANTP